MNNFLLRTYIGLQQIARREDGQGLAEYALVIPLIAFGAVVGMAFLANAINHAFEKISFDLTSAVS